MTIKLSVNLSPVALEADLAYFGARIEFVGYPQTTCQIAQLKVYRVLEEILRDRLKHLRGEPGDRDGHETED